MGWPKWLALVLTFLRSAWMTFDGVRALTIGDYVTPQEGPYAGQLGPWSHVVDAIGIPPRSLTMKWIFVALGLLGLMAAVVALAGVRGGWASIVALAVATLWYLPIGTTCSVLVILSLALRHRGFP